MMIHHRLNDYHYDYDQNTDLTKLTAKFTVSNTISKTNTL